MILTKGEVIHEAEDILREVHNARAKFEALETSVNEWLAEHPNIAIENTNDLSQPNATWSHLALAVWYSEK